jgi:parallel beta-helix repeat protein
MAQGERTMKHAWLRVVLIAAIAGAANPAWGDSYVMAVPKKVGTPIASLPYNINQPGLYYLAGNLSISVMSYAITIEVSDVTFDLRGFSLTGPVVPNGYGIVINYSLRNVEVRNGQVKSFDTGVWSRPSGNNHRLVDLKVSGCSTGIRGDADGIIITGCQLSANTDGIYSASTSAVIDQNTASGNTMRGFALSSHKGVITNNFATGNDTGFSLGSNPGQLVDRNASVQNTTANWVGLSGCTNGLNTP